MPYLETTKIINPFDIDNFVFVEDAEGDYLNTVTNKTCSKIGKGGFFYHRKANIKDYCKLYELKLTGYTPVKATSEKVDNGRFIKIVVLWKKDVKGIVS